MQNCGAFHVFCPVFLDQRFKYYAETGTRFDPSHADRVPARAGANEI
jgi:hypothetical protein